MKPALPLLRLTLSVAFAAAAAASGPALGQAQGGAAPGAVDIGSRIPDADAVKEGLFPEDACKELEASGFKCMGIKPAIRYSVPAGTFKVGSAELPELVKKQLDVFAQVLRSKRGSGRQIRLTGHADASGTAEANQVLSTRRAEAARDYLVQKGADPAMLVIEGQGSKVPANPANPRAPENRRIDIDRADSPPAR
jgi:OOP family OmpA-OmpF porin